MIHYYLFFYLGKLSFLTVRLLRSEIRHDFSPLLYMVRFLTFCVSEKWSFHEENNEKMFPGVTVQIEGTSREAQH